MMAYALFLFVIFYFCYKRASKIYEDESITFYRVVHSRRVSKEIKYIALQCHKRSFSPFVWFVVLCGIILLPFGRKRESKNQIPQISKRDEKILRCIMASYFRINCTFMFPFYLFVFVVGTVWLLIWLFIQKFTLNMQKIATQIINNIYTHSLNAQGKT